MRHYKDTANSDSGAEDGDGDVGLFGVSADADGADADVGAVAAVEALDADEPELSAATGSGGGEPDWWVSKLGYLYCPRLRPLPRAIAHIGATGSRLHCTRHLHSKCGQKAGMATTGVTKYHIVEWALRGVVLPDDADTEVKRAAGEAHMRVPWRPT